METSLTLTILFFTIYLAWSSGVGGCLCLEHYKNSPRIPLIWLVVSHLPRSFPCFPMCLRRKAPMSILCGSEWPYLLHLVHHWQAWPCSLGWSEHPLLLTGHQDQGDCCFFTINLHISHHDSTPLWFYLLLENNRLHLSSSLPLAISPLHPPSLPPVPLCSIYVSYLKPLVSTSFWLSLLVSWGFSGVG